MTIGGSHQGDFDFADSVLARLEARLHFRRIRLNLGGSTLFASRGSTLFFGLPGTPMASWLAFEVLVRPALWRLCGREGLTRPLLRARLAEPLAVSAGRTHFIPALLALSPDAEPVVTPLTRGAALALPPSLLANGLIHWPAEATALEAGATVPVEWLGEP
jgi:molybdopterin molybdotransferase